MADEFGRSICVGDDSPLSMFSLARINLDPKTYRALYEAKEDLRLDPRDHLLARITPRELVFITYLCLHPEETDEEVMSALGLCERTVLAYFTHLGRNFNVRNSSQLRNWAGENRLVSLPDLASEDDEPVERFDPWARWY